MPDDRKPLNLTVDADVRNALQKEADAEDRPLGRHVERILRRYVEDVADDTDETVPAF